MSGFGDLIREADAALEGITPGWVYSPDNVYAESGDADYFDVDGPHGGYVARCEDSETARFVVAAPDLVRRLRDALESADKAMEWAQRAIDRRDLAFDTERDRSIRLAIKLAGHQQEIDNYRFKPQTDY